MHAIGLLLIWICTCMPLALEPLQLWKDNDTNLAFLLLFISSLKSQPDQGWILHHSHLPQRDKHIRVCVRSSWSVSYTTTFRQSLPWYPPSHYVRTTSLGNCYCAAVTFLQGLLGFFVDMLLCRLSWRRKYYRIYIFVTVDDVCVCEILRQSISYLLIVFVRVPFYFRWSTKMRGWWFVCVDSTTD